VSHLLKYSYQLSSFSTPPYGLILHNELFIAILSIAGSYSSIVVLIVKKFALIHVTFPHIGNLTKQNYSL
jgi:hypothetical protein